MTQHCVAIAALGALRLGIQGDPGAARDVLTGRVMPNIPLALLARRYRLLEEIGSGTHARVFRAEDTKTGTEVAVKRLRPELVGQRAWADRLLREADTVAAIAHPGVVRVHEIGWDERGMPFVAMELLRGETLAARVEREGPLAPEEAGEIALAILWALEHVHAAGVVHRDVKPDNVMLVEGAEARVVLLDFGLARLRARAGLTGPGAILGTPRYMSPEQVRGAVADARADLWSTGVLLHFALTGKTPFDGANVLAVMHAILSTEARPPSAFVPGIDAAMDEVVATALLRDPRVRFESAAQMREALEVAMLPAVPSVRRRADSGVRALAPEEPAAKAG